MPDESPEKIDRRLWGQAVRALRKRQGKTLYEAAQAYEPENFTPGDPDKGISVQRWGQIEKGQATFSEDQQRRLARAVGAKLDDLLSERARILGHSQRASAGGGERDVRALVIPLWGRTELDRDGWKVTAADVSESAFDVRELLGPSIGATHVADDLMQPKARPGAIVIFDRSRRPDTDHGCVIETVGGELYPRIFVEANGLHITVRTLKGEAPERYARDQVKGVYAVRFWGD